jgi:hypothetical protein
MSPQRRTIAQRVNDYLAEPPGEQFVNGKWKFWFIAVAFLSVINAVLTWLIFRDDGENYSGPIMLSVGALVAWLCVGALHYSDSSDRKLARGVSAVDSIALLFVVCHFSGLLWIYGHHRTLRSAEARYEQQAEKFNVEAHQIQDANVKIAEAAQAIATENRKRARLENDSIYQARRIIEAGGKVPSSRSASAPGVTAPGLGTSTVELERPTKPAESSAAFLTKWDWAIRLANCGELLLACLTLILIRNVSARSNSPRSPEAMNFDSLFSVAARSPVPRPAFSTTHVSSKADDTNAQRKTTHVSSKNLAEGLKRLRETLKEISFYTPGQRYKADVRDNCVWIRAMVSDYGVQRTASAAKAKLDILADAMAMERNAFRERLEKFLRQNGFEI